MHTRLMPLLCGLSLVAGCSSMSRYVYDDGGNVADDGISDPGRVVLHRLNRAEYNNTVRDLLGTSLNPADSFPIDDLTSGYDNIASTLSISPLHVEMYEWAAQLLVEEVLFGDVVAIQVHVEAEGDEISGTTGDVRAKSANRAAY